MRQNTKRFSSLMLALVFLIGALIVFFELVQPAYNDLQGLRGKEIAQQNFLSNEQQIVQQVKSLVSSYQSQAQGEQSVSLALPINTGAAGAITQLSGLAQATNIAIQTMSISSQAAPQVQAGVGRQAVNAGTGVTAAAATGNIVKPLGVMSFQVSAAGTYENFKNFLQGLESNTRIFDVKSISIHQGSAVGKASQDYFFYDLTVVAYYQTS